jgi:ubiquinone biosynthesis protein
VEDLMLRALANTGRLLKAARKLAAYEALIPVEFEDQVPGGAKLAVSVLRFGARRRGQEGDTPEAQAARLAEALQELGPTYIKLGQFLATRPDIVGDGIANGLNVLQDRLPPFGSAEAERRIARDLGKPVKDLYAAFGEPLAAASIAQVHQATTTEGELVAVKVLRPDIERRFREDLEAFFFAARLAERVFPASKRLEPVKAVETLKDSVDQEMDLRLEAAAASQLKENTKGDADFVVPEVDWARTGKSVLTTEWVGGSSLRSAEELRAAGHEPKQIANLVIQTFLTHALRDGFFHADMHPGNLFVDEKGRLVAVDFGIMGRITRAERKFMAETLYGFLCRDYERIADVHFDIGYVPPAKSREDFALALRSVGERIFGRHVSEISMAGLLAQLFEITRRFGMHMQPSLLLLQKTMVVVEGVARNLDPEHNIWEASRPVVEKFMTDYIGPEARVREAADAAGHLARIATRLPDMIEKLEDAAIVVTDMVDEEGVRLHPETAKAIGEAEARGTRSGRVAMWVGAGALVAMALAALFG